MSKFKVQTKSKEKDILTLSHFDIPLTFELSTLDFSTLRMFGKHDGESGSSTQFAIEMDFPLMEVNNLLYQ